MRVVEGNALDDGVDEPGIWDKCIECGSTEELFFDDDGDLICEDCMIESASVEDCE